MLKNNQEYNDTVKSNTAFLTELRNKLPEFFTAEKYDDEGNLVVEAGFDLEKFQRALKERNIEELSSGYQLDFIGKDYAKKQAGEKSTTVIVPDVEHNELLENKNSQNLFFTGDNLEVLRHLQNNYTNSIDMIYIDPPYNTGSDGFVYSDNFEYSDQALVDMFGLNDEELKRLKSIQGKATHSAWLTFMYPRLWLAKRVLKETGIIFISIDDNECANLKNICDEIFGEINFIANFLWKKKGTTSNVDGAEVSSILDNTLCYRKSGNARIHPRVTKSTERTYPHYDKEGNYRTQVIEKKNDGSYARSSMVFPIIGHRPRKGKRWQIGKDKALALEKLNRFQYDGEKVILKVYDFEDNDSTSAHSNLLDAHGSSDSAGKEIKCLFNNIAVFDTAKPIDLIKHLTQISTTICQASWHH